METDPENFCKESILLFFFETTDDFLSQFEDEELFRITKWLSKIIQLDLHSMRIHLLLLYHVLKNGVLRPPFDADPNTVNLQELHLDRSYIDLNDSNLQKLHRLVAKTWAYARKNAEGGECENRNGFRRTASDRENLYGTAPSVHRNSRRDQQSMLRSQASSGCSSGQHQPDRTFSIRSQSQPRQQGDVDDVTDVGGRRSRSLSREEIECCRHSVRHCRWNWDTPMAYSRPEFPKPVTRPRSGPFADHDLSSFCEMPQKPKFRIPMANRLTTGQGGTDFGSRSCLGGCRTRLAEIRRHPAKE